MRRTQIYSGNITHNLGGMAEAAGIQKHLWRPDELGIKRAGDLIQSLKAGLDNLRADPAKFEAMNPKNGWGSYTGLVDFVHEYVRQCIKNPDAEIEISR